MCVEEAGFFFSSPYFHQDSRESNHVTHAAGPRPSFLWHIGLSPCTPLTRCRALSSLEGPYLAVGPSAIPSLVDVPHFYAPTLGRSSLFVLLLLLLLLGSILRVTPEVIVPYAFGPNPYRPYPCMRRGESYWRPLPAFKARHDGKSSC